MAKVARKLEDERNAKVVSTPSAFERAFEGYLDKERTEASKTRQLALMALAEQNWQPKVPGPMRERVDEAYAQLDALSDQEKVYFYAHLQEAEPELYKAMRDAIDDDDAVLGMTWRMEDEEHEASRAAYEAAERAMFQAEEDVLATSRAAIERHPLYLRLTEKPIDTEGVEILEGDDLQVA